MDSSTFSIQPIGRFAGPSQPVKRPREFTHFSYDEDHVYRPDDSSVKYYYTPQAGTSLCGGFDSFVKHDDSEDEHLVSLLRAVRAHEEKEGKAIDAQVVTWRGMMTKIMATPFENRDGFEMNATMLGDSIFIEENHAYKMASRGQQEPRRRGPSSEMMSYWGYKFETLSTLPAPWGETSRDYIEGRDSLVVNNKEQYCSVVRTGIGGTILCLGGEVDALWDSRPREQGAPINWVELKTSQSIASRQDMDYFHAKLMKFWIQSFLLGVPKIIVGFRTRDGILTHVEEIETEKIPDRILSQPQPKWDPNLCLNFAAEFLAWLRKTIHGEGVWRIRRRPGEGKIEVYKVEDSGVGDVLTQEFVDWRSNLAARGEDGN